MLLVASETSPSPRAVWRDAGAMTDNRAAKNTFSRGGRPQHFFADNCNRLVRKRTNTLHHVTDTRIASGRPLRVPRASPDCPAPVPHQAQIEEVSKMEGGDIAISFFVARIF